MELKHNLYLTNFKICQPPFVMKKYIFILTVSFLFSFSAFSQGGLENIVFTAKPDAVNGLDIYAKNVSSTSISGILGGGFLTLCALVPASINPQPTVSISTPIAGLTFGAAVTDTVTVNGILYDVYDFNGSANSTSAVTFASNIEVLLGTYSFTGIPLATSSVLLAMLPAGGTSGFDYCYIAPNGTDETNYANPFYSDITNDPGLHNANGLNDYTLNGLSYLAVSGVTLPVKFMGFSAVKNDNSALLNWAVENENATSENYVVERSFDGVTFTDIASVPAKENASSNTYGYTDEGLSALNSSGIIYYRIIQVDKNGSYTYTNIQAVRLVNGIIVKAYPNPVKDVALVSINLPEAANISVDISDVNGKNLQRMEIAGAKGSNQNRFDLSGYAAGSYILKVSSGTEVTSVTLVKQ